MNITEELNEQVEASKSIEELSLENISDIERVWNQHQVVPLKYVPALIAAAKKALTLDA